MPSSAFKSLTATALSIALLAMNLPAQAHISYTGRDFGALTAGATASKAGSVSSNYGWADASDASLAFNSALASTRDATTDGTYVGGNGTDDLYLGDSHKGRAFKLHLDTALDVTFTASAASGLTSAFSVYQGLASPAVAPQTSADHDYAVASQAWRTSFAQGVAGAGYNYLATNGSWNALGNWSIGGDGDPAGVGSAMDNFVYKGSGASTVANGTATTTLTLGPGDYTVFVGGNSIADKSLLNATKSYAFTLGVTAAAPVPEPESLALALAGLVTAVALRGRQRAA
jgi:hypothetical protein